MQINNELSIGSISQFVMNMLRKRHYLNVDVKKRGFVFAKCIMCKSLKDLISKLGRNNNDVRKYAFKLKKHLFASRVVQKLVPYLEV